MCGHVGIAGKLEYKDEATMKRLLVYDYFRGPDSTGFAALRNNGDTKIVKIASHPLDLFDMKRFVDALSGHNSSVFLGHNRLATKGIVNGVNAHPYQYDHIIGAHNGTLDFSSWRALEEALNEKFDVDSQAIIAAIARLGIDKTVPLLQGAWALVWIDTKEGTLNFLRNKERPFWYAYSKEFNKILWASEWPMLEAAIKLSTQGYELFSDPEKGYRYWATKEDWWYKFTIEELIKGSEGRPKPRVKELKGKEPAPAVTYTCGGQHPFHRHVPMTTSTGSKGGTDKDKDKDKEKKDNVSILHLNGTKTQPFGGYVTKEEFDKIAKYGCSWCQSDVEFTERGVQVFMQQDMVLCPKCSDNDDTRVYVDGSVMVG